MTKVAWLMVRQVIALAIACAAPLAHAQEHGGTVVLRRGEPAPAYPPVAVDTRGVHVGIAGEPATVVRTISWDRVRRVDGPLAAQAAAYSELAATVWRAQARLERGDAVAAEPLFERAAEMLTGDGSGADERAAEDLVGPTHALVHAGLVRCRLERGALAAAVLPWLDVRAAVLAGAVEELPDAIDPVTALVPGLPPIFARTPAVRALALMDNRPSWPAEVSSLAVLYSTAAALAAGESVAWVEPAELGPGTILVRDCVAAQAREPEVRAAARERLVERLEAGAAKPWVRAWCHAAIGRSLARESDREQRRRGVVHLLTVPAEYRFIQPYLAGTCLADAATALDALGDREGARLLALELAREHSQHPALGALDPALRAPTSIDQQEPPA